MTSRRVRRSLFELQPRADFLLDQYTDPARLYAFATYDQSPIHRGRLTPADVLMANLLSLRLGWREVIPLFAQADTVYTTLRHALDDALNEARNLPPLEELDDDQITMPALTQAHRAAEDARPLNGGRRVWGAVAVSKVLHRLAPVVPVYDSTVRHFYANTYAGHIRAALRDDLQANRAWLAPLAEHYLIRGRPAPLTRIADILIWTDARLKDPQGRS